jgi:hypothetical protein
MRLTLAIQGFAALAVAMPAARPQEIDINLVLNAPEPVTYDPAVGVTAQVVSYDYTSLVAQATAPATSTTSDVASTATAIEKRGAACTSLAPAASGAPTYSPDTPAAFASNSDFSSVAVNAPVPTGYTQTFSNVNASNRYLCQSNRCLYKTDPDTALTVTLDSPPSAISILPSALLSAVSYTCRSSIDDLADHPVLDAIYGCLSFNLYFERDPSVDPGSGASGCENPASVTYIKVNTFLPYS